MMIFIIIGVYLQWIPPSVLGVLSQKNHRKIKNIIKQENGGRDVVDQIV